MGGGLGRTLATGDDNEHCQHGKRRHLEELRPLHRRGGRGNGWHHYRLARIADDVAAFIAVVRGMRNTTSAAASIPCSATDRDLPGGFVFGAIAVVILVPALVPGILGGNVEILPRIVCSAGIALFGILFVTVAAGSWVLWAYRRNRPRGSHWSRCWEPPPSSRCGVDRRLRPGRRSDRRCRRSHRASKAGDISQDLKTGYLVGARPQSNSSGNCWARA